MDYAHSLTDKEIELLGKKYKSIYDEASKRAMQNYEEYFESKEFAKVAKEYDDLSLAAKNGGKKEKAALEKFSQVNIAYTDRFLNVSENMAAEANAANVSALALANRSAIGTFALHHNFEAFRISNDVGIEMAFDIYDKNVVENLVKNNPDLLPKRKLNKSKDIAWNKVKFNNEITQAVLTGEPITKTAYRLENVMGMNKNAAVRNARTALTGAQNAGRETTYRQAIEMGIQIEKEWVSTLDGRTRDSHRDMDGERIPVDGIYSNGLEYPGDPNGAPAEVYNCRCTERSRRIVSKAEGQRRYRGEDGKNHLTEYKTYREWERTI